MNKEQQRVVCYYQALETRLIFGLFLRGSKHFGFYPNGDSGMSEREAQILLQEMVAKNLDLKDDQRVLDAGCGQGVVSTYLAKKYGCEIWGVTLVPFEVERAQQLSRKLAVQDKVHYRVMDYSNTTFSENYFDAIYTTETLSHSPDIRATLGEFLRILKPGGKIALFEYTMAPDNEFTDRERGVVDWVIDHTAMMGLKDFRHDRFIEVLRNLGFVNVEEEDISKNMMPSFYRIYRFLRWPYQVIETFNLRGFFINVTAGYEFYEMVKKGLFRYCIFTADKPR